MKERMTDERLAEIESIVEDDWPLEEEEGKDLIAEVKRLHSELTVREVLDAIGTGDEIKLMRWEDKNEADHWAIFAGQGGDDVLYDGFDCLEVLAVLTEYVRGKPNFEQPPFEQSPFRVPGESVSHKEPELFKL